MLTQSCCCRNMLPILLALLQHPSEDRRAFAAENLAVFALYANHVVASAVLTPDSVALSTILTRLSGDDSPESRSNYARLISNTVGPANEGANKRAALKKISDSGAVPYLLKLLKESKSYDQKDTAVRCLSVGPTALVQPFVLQELPTSCC